MSIALYSDRDSKCARSDPRKGSGTRGPISLYLNKLRERQGELTLETHTSEAKSSARVAERDRGAEKGPRTRKTRKTT